MSLAGSLANYVRQPVYRRRFLTLADQGVSSLSNILAALLVARSFDAPEPFGAFGLAMVAFQLMLGVARAIVGEPFLTLYSGASRSERDRLAPDLVTMTALIGVASSLVLVLVGFIVGGLSREALLGLAVVLPLVLVQDTWRFIFVIDRAGAALIIDLVWLISMAMAFVFAPADAGVGWYVIVWGLGGGLGAVAAFVLAGGIRRRPNPWRWLVEHKSTCGGFLAEWATSGAIGQLVIMMLAPIGGLKALGAARAAQVFYGPHFTLHAGIYLTVVPEGVQSREDPKALRRLLVVTGRGLASVAILWMALGLVVPTGWGEALLGSSWDGAVDLMVPFGLAMAATGFAAGGRLGLRSLADVRRTVTTRLKISPWQLLCPLLGALVGGVVGFGIGFAVGRVATALIYWRAFEASLKDHTPEDRPRRHYIVLVES